jgi:hypothetical protein
MSRRLAVICLRCLLALTFAGAPWTYDLDPNLMYLPFGKPKVK